MHSYVIFNPNQEKNYLNSVTIRLCSPVGNQQMFHHFNVTESSSSFNRIPPELLLELLETTLSIIDCPDN